MKVQVVTSFLLALALLCALSLRAHALPKPLDPLDIFYVNTTTNRIIDGAGRERYFHGVNVVVKGPPWIPRTDTFDPLWSFVEEDMVLLRAWGMNAIRYGMMWPGAEPERGTYNETYFSASKDIVNKASQYGIYTLLDMHQDVLSEKFCGEGIPDWAVDIGNAKDFPFPLGDPYKTDDANGYPSDEDCAKHSWSSYQMAHATGAAYQNLYNNSNGLADQMALFWGKVAQTFADNQFVLGYEVINEPWAGDVYANPELLIPTEADKINLANFYEILHTEIRKHDDKHSFYFESVTWDQFSVGFESVPGGDSYRNRSVLSWHFYIPPQLNDYLSFYEKQKDVKKLGCAGFLTEFSLQDAQLKTTLKEADKYLQSWLAWDFKPYDEITGSSANIWSQNGTLNTTLVQWISRSYAQVVAGVTLEMNFDPDSRVFSLKYYTTHSCSSDTTEIYLNEKLHYGAGYTVAVTIGGKQGGQWMSPEANYVHVQHDISLPQGTIVMVTITPKASTMKRNDWL